MLALAELLWPERCLLCDRDPTRAAWARAGPRVRGLRSWDRPHLCAPCADHLAPAARRCSLRLAGGARLTVAAARTEDAPLVALVGALKYHGIRGVAWPLAELGVAAADLFAADAGWPAAALVPMPLHPSRRRQRGFNQAQLLADLLALRLGRPCRPEALRRCRATPQQAKLAPTGPARARNVQGAFAAGPPPLGLAEAVLVDDLATTGETLAAAAGALNAAGWHVLGALVLGAAVGLGRAPADP